MPAVPLVILMIGLVASLAVAWQLAKVTEARSHARFDGLVESAVGAINAKIDIQLALLRSMAGLYASDDAVSPEEFNAYVEQLDLEKNYRGTLGIGYARYAATPADVDWVNHWMATEGRDPSFRMWPAGTRDRYSAILYLQPTNVWNEHSIGFDMMSDPVRRAAMLRAAETGQLAMSGKVKLLQEPSPKMQTGFLIYLPVYQNNPAEAQLPAARRTLRGWIYSPLRPMDLFSVIFERRQQREVSIAIHAGDPKEGNLLYRTTPSNSSAPRYRSLVPIDIAGQHWTVEVATTPSFDAESPLTLPLTLGFAGIVVSFLLAALSTFQVRAVQDTERKVEERTAELSAANLLLREESASREAAEAQVRQMQKMEAVGQLTGGVAHDFNNMLAIIIGNLDLAKRRAGDRARLDHVLDQAMEGAKRAAALTQRLLAFARRQALMPQPLDANTLVSGMSDMLTRTLGETVRLQTILSGRVWKLFADAGQLENAIVNLAVNARDAMPDGGRLTIETANATLDDSYARSHSEVVPGDYVLIAVTDTGAGMPREVLDRAFDPFFTTKSIGKGTGLGLSQVFGFVQQSGGHVRLESEPGVGTTVKLYLPRHAAPEAIAEPSTVPENVLPTGREAEIVLVVEDEDRVRMMSVETLRDLGYSVLQADSGAEALRILEKDVEITMLFTDVVMPDMNGRKLADAVRAQRPDVKLLFTTGYTRDAIVHDGTLEAGVELLPKPFTIRQLATKVRAVLDA